MLAAARDAISRATVSLQDFVMLSSPGRWVISRAVETLSDICGNRHLPQGVRQ